MLLFIIKHAFSITKYNRMTIEQVQWWFCENGEDPTVLLKYLVKSEIQNSKDFSDTFNPSQNIHTGDQYSYQTQNSFDLLFSKLELIDSQIQSQKVFIFYF